jgi:hypothetical protein
MQAPESRYFSLYQMRLPLENRCKPAAKVLHFLSRAAYSVKALQFNG